MNIYRPSSENLVKNDIYRTVIDGVLYLDQSKFTDQRGWYSELARIPELNQVLEKPFEVQQINLSLSQTKVIRGFHAENWNKLIMPLSGKCMSVVADLRPKSPTFGKTLTFNFSVENGDLVGCIYLPAGVANSFYVVEGPVNYLYCVDRLYKNRNPSGDIAINLFDPDLAIDWPVPQSEMLISDRDKGSVSLREKFPKKFI